MTIYILDSDSIKCAQMLDDKALGKMISAIAQALCNVHFKLLDTINKKYLAVGQLTSHEHDARHMANSIFCLFTIKPENLDDTYTNWASECRANYLKLIEMGLACCEEWEYKFNQVKILYGKKYVTSKNGERKEYERKLHKHHDLIHWCADNVPDLPRVLAKLDTTPFPLVMPKKYLPKFIPLKYVYDEDKTEYIQFCYRNYYKALLLKRICPKCCNGMSVKGCEKNNVVWTRREKPEWLGDL